MNVKLVIAALSLGLAFSAFGTAPEAPDIKFYGWRSVEYPPAARHARLEGTAVVRAKLKHGQFWEYIVDRVEVKSGDPVLAKTAADNLKKQTFYCEHCKSLEGTEVEIAYEFRFDQGCQENDQCFKQSSTLRAGRVIVESSVPESPVNAPKPAGTGGVP